MSKPALYIAPVSVNCFGPWLLLKEIGLDFELVTIDMIKGEHKTPEFLAINPLGQIPAFRDGPHNFFEGNSIMRYICSKFLGYAQQAKFYSPDPLIRGKIEIALDWRQTAWYPAVSKVSYTKLFGVDPEKFNEEEGKRELDRLVPILQYFLANNDFIAGSEPSIADMAIVPTFQFIKVSDWEFPKFLKDYESRFYQKTSSWDSVYSVALKGFIEWKMSSGKTEIARGTLYTSPVHVDCLGPMILLKHAKINQIETITIDLKKGENISPDFMAINPLGTVPALSHEKIKIGESSSILRYFASKFKGAKQFYPSDPDIRAPIDMVLDWIQSSWVPTIDKFSPKNPEKVEEGKKFLKEHLVVLNSWLRNTKFLRSDTITIADISLVPTLVYMELLDINIPEFLDEYRSRFIAQIECYSEVMKSIVDVLNDKRAKAPPTLYVTLGSPNCLGSWLLLKEIGIPIRVNYIDLSKGEHKTEDFLRINPSGRVPFLIDGNLSIFESGAILRYICNKYPRARNYYSLNSNTRAIINIALDWRQTVWWPNLLKLIGKFFGMKEDLFASEKARTILLENIPILARFFGGKSFIGGDTPSIADLSIIPTLPMLHTINISLPAHLATSVERLGKAMPFWNDISVELFGFVDNLLKNTKISRSLTFKRVLYFNAISVNCISPYILLKEAGVDFEVKVVNLNKGEHKTPEFLAINPVGQIPAFVDSDGTTLYESSAILRYIAEKYAPFLYGDMSPDWCAAIDIILDWRQTTWYPSVANSSYSKLFGLSTEVYNPEKGIAGLIEAMATLEGFLGDRDFLVGDDLSIADLSFAPTLAFLLVSDFVFPKFLKAYFNRFQKTVQSWHDVFDMALKEHIEKISKPTQEVEDITSKLFDKPTADNKLIVVGGGFAGLKIATYTKLLKKYQVLMIDTKDYWEYTPSVPRTLIQPEKIELLTIPHSKNVKKFHRGQVTEVNNTHVVVDELYKINFDYLVICSGSRYPSISGGNISKEQKKIKIVKKAEANMKDQYGDFQKRHQVIGAEANRIKNAKHIVIIGGGPVGIELMAEICTKYPNKKLTMVCSEASFMPQMKNPTLTKRITAFFNTYGVILRMGERVVNVSEAFGRYTLTTTAEINNKLEADRVYFCAGQIPNTEFMKRHLPQTLDNRNQIKVHLDSLRVEGFTNVWALGDCNNSPEPKTAHVANVQATHFVKNFSKMVAGKKFSNYTLVPNPAPMIVITLGPFKAVFAAGTKVLSTGTLAVTAKNQFQSSFLTKYNQEKSLLKIDYEKLITKDIKSMKDDTEENEEEEGQAALLKLEAEFDFH